MKKKTMIFLACMLMLMGYASVHADSVIKLDLPKADGKPGNPSKPVKVYLLAGQSNMVGMGTIKGASPLNQSVFYSADPAIVPGKMLALKGPTILFPQPIGKAAVASHGVYQSADAHAKKGAVASIFKGDYDSKVDYSKMTPVKTAVFPLGTVKETIPSIEGPHTAVATAWIDVPKTGTYNFHPGFKDSNNALLLLDGKQVYLKKPGTKPTIENVSLEAGKRYPITITYIKGGSAALWLKQVDILGKGDLEMLTKKDRKFTFLLDDEGKWSFRKDVNFHEARVGRREGSFLNAASNGNTIGPELGFGWVMGEFHDEQILLIKTAIGNRSLKFDFRPPSSGRNNPDNKWEGLEYRLMTKGVEDTLTNIAKIVPDYKGQGYEIAGFCWFQGHKDGGSTKEEYEKLLVNLINDVRKDFNAPNMPAVVAAVGFGGYRLEKGLNYEKSNFYRSPDRVDPYTQYVSLSAHNGWPAH